MWFLPVFGETNSGDPIPVRIVQTNISLDQPWVQPEANQLLDELGTLSTEQRKQTAAGGVAGNSGSVLSERGRGFRARMQAIARKLGAYFLVGYIDMLGEDPSNSAALLSPEGSVVSRYNKMHLVPFGEYIPMKRFLFFAESLHEAGWGLRARHRIHDQSSRWPSHLDGNLLREHLSGPHAAIREARFASCSFSSQTMAGSVNRPRLFSILRMGVVRAVENRRYMVRTANTGISAIIDPYGRIESSTRSACGRFWMARRTSGRIHFLHPIRGCLRIR